MEFTALIQTHRLLAALSVVGFILRWFWKEHGSPLASQRWVRIAPHVLDTLFLLTGIALAWLTSRVPGADPFINSKLSGLIVYILLGMAAMNERLPGKARVFAFAGALAVFAWIVSVGLTRHPLGFVGLLTGP